MSLKCLAVQSLIEGGVLVAAGVLRNSSDMQYWLREEDNRTKRGELLMLAVALSKEGVLTADRTEMLMQIK